MHTGCQYALEILKSEPTPCQDLTLSETLLSKCVAVSQSQLNQTCDNKQALSNPERFIGKSRVAVAQSGPWCFHPWPRESKCRSILGQDT